jgi:hypothetical protein
MFKGLSKTSQEKEVEKDDTKDSLKDVNFTEAFLNAGNFNKSTKDEKEVNAKELEMGIKVEHEHTTSAALARRIALDHLSEIPDYYTRLDAMETEAKKAMKK